HALNRDLDRSFADKPHLRVNVVMWRMWISVRRQCRLVRFDMFASCEFAFDDVPYLRMIRVLHRHVLEFEDCRRQRIVLSTEAGDSVSTNQRWNKAASLSPRKSHMHLSGLQGSAV